MKQRLSEIGEEKALVLHKDEASTQGKLENEMSTGSAQIYLW